MGRNAKLVLPTIDTCQWRDVCGANTRCRIVSSKLGAMVAEVTDDACRACCDSYPPTTERLNPVVASLLYSAALNIAADESSLETARQNAQSILEFAERSLSLTHLSEETLIPARMETNCAWLVGSDLEQASEQTIHRNPVASLSIQNSRSPVSGNKPKCSHPNHCMKDLDYCRSCRDWVKSKPVSRILELEEIVPCPLRRYGAPIKEWAVGITTSPRRVPTLEACMDSLARAGWNDVRLFLDGTLAVPASYDRIPISWRDDSIGAWPAWYMALAELVLHQPNADVFMLLQDDVILYDRAPLKEYLEKTLWPSEQDGIVSLFYTGVQTEVGWFEAKGAWHFSAQAIVLSPRSARELLSDTTITQSWITAAGGVHVPIPEMIFEWTTRRRKEVWYTYPSLAQHIGNTSTIWMDSSIIGGRRSSYFSGAVETEVGLDESLGDFPDQLFVLPSDRMDRYQESVRQGKELISSSNVVIAGLCRDVRLHLPRTAARIERLGNMFNDYRVELYENDSKDATIEFLEDWRKKNPRIDFQTEQKGIAKFARERNPDRATWLAYCRNQYRQRVLEKYSEYDYIIVVDMDLEGGWSYDGIAHSFGSGDWDFVGSNGLMKYQGPSSTAWPFFHFDTWAFRPSVGTFPYELPNHNEIRFTIGESLLPVESCFGGLGLYRMECFEKCQYGGNDCEHVVFHADMKRKGLNRLYLNPNQIVLYSPN